MTKAFHYSAIIVCLSLIFFKGFSQDTLVMKNGALISSKIMEVSADKIRYKRYDNPEGPVFIVNSYEVTAIKYKNGMIDSVHTRPIAIAEAAHDLTPPIYKQGPYFVQGYNKFRQKQMHQLVSQTEDPVILSYVNKSKSAKKLEPLGFVAIPAFVFGMGWTGYAILESLSGYPVSFAPTLAAFAVTAGSLAASITFKIRGNHFDAAAIRAYNEKY